MRSVIRDSGTQGPPRTFSLKAGRDAMRVSSRRIVVGEMEERVKEGSESFLSLVLGEVEILSSHPAFHSALSSLISLSY